MKAKRNAFAALDWLVWKLLALIDLPIAKRKVVERRRAEAHGGLTARLRRRRQTGAEVEQSASAP